LEHLFGITPVMWSRQEFVLGELSVLVGIQGVKTVLAARPRRTLTTLALS